MKHKRVIAALVISTGGFGAVPVHAESIWDLPGAPEQTDGSDEEAVEYFTNLEEIESIRETITEEGTLTEEAQNDLLTVGPGSIYARATGDTPGYWDNSTGYWKYWLSNEGRWQQTNG